MIGRVVLTTRVVGTGQFRAGFDSRRGVDVTAACGEYTAGRGWAAQQTNITALYTWAKCQQNIIENLY